MTELEKALERAERHDGRYNLTGQLLPKDDNLGHRTRYSDSCNYDAVCVLCGATDGPCDTGLSDPCPNSVPDHD